MEKNQMQQKQSHSPLPWKVSGVAIDSGNIYVARCVNWSELSKRANAQGSLRVPLVDEAQANAEFIVKACNSYYELLETCRLSLRLVEAVENKGLGNADTQMLSNTLKAAIAKAEG